MASGKKSGDSVSDMLSPVEDIMMKVANAIPLSYPKAWVALYFHPSEETVTQAKGAGLAGAVINFVLAGILYWIATVVMGLLSGGLFGAMVGGLFGIIVIPIALILGGFVTSLIFWIVAKVLGGKGSYTAQTYLLAVAYGGYMLLAFPFLALSGIPFIGMLFGLVLLLVGLYSLYVVYKVIKTLHGLSTIKAIAVILIPMIIMTIITVIIGAIMAAAIIGMMGTGALAGAY